MANDAPFYEIEGVKYPRVSTICGLSRNPSLEEWRGRLGNKAANKVMRTAAKVGSRVHEIIEAVLKSDKFTFKKSDPLEVHRSVQAFLEWQTSRKVMAGQTELTVWSPSLRYAGTIDLVSSTTLYDWKTASRVSPAYWLQLMAYQRAYEEQGLGKIDEIVVVRLDKELGTFEEVRRDVTDCGRYWDAFKGLLDYYHSGIMEEYDHGDSCREEADKPADSQVDGGQEVDGPEVLDAGGGEDREVGFLGSGPEDPLLGM